MATSNRTASNGAAGAGQHPAKAQDGDRFSRSATALRENLRRRKAQRDARAEAEPEGRGDAADGPSVPDRQV